MLPPTDLPVEAAVGSVRTALGAGGAAVLVAPPGAGKTTVVPLRLLDEPWLGAQRIVVLEPRRLAARAAANRMADLLGEPVGATVGYRTAEDRQVSAATRIEVVTEGILVRQLQDDPGLDGVGLVVLDEVHERNLVSDLSLALLVDVRSSLRPDLRVLAMSATVAAEQVAASLGGAPILRSEGRAHPVAVSYDPPPPGSRLDAHVARAVATTLAAHPDGDALVFLPGAADIRRVADRLAPAGALAATVDVVPLFGALTGADQDRALQPSPEGRRRVVLATDIAESSLTVAGVRLVVDAGLVRVPRFDPASAMTRLQTEPTSLASADQRAGRAGRLGPGVAVRLWDRSDQARRPAYPVPEIAVADLTGLALEVAVWGAPVADLALPDQPPGGAWADAHATLRALHAIDLDGRPTARGRAMATLPLHPRLAALALAAADDGDPRVASTGALLAAVLEERDVLRGRPGEVPTDLALRVELLADRGRAHPQLDRAAARSARRRAEQVARRLRLRLGPVEPDAVGPLVAVAYPERIAQAGGGGGYRLRGGGGGALAPTDPLASSELLAVARIEPGPRGPELRLAAHLDRAEVEALVADEVTIDDVVAWDPARRDVRAVRTRRAGALVLSQTSQPAEPGEATTAALLDQVRATNGDLLRFSDGARRLQGRLAFLHRHDPDRWPDVSDEGLLGSLEEWLVPMAPGLRSVRDLARVDVASALTARLGHHQRQDLARLAPTSFTTATGRTIAIAYGPDGPRASTRAQDLYGTTTHPMVADGRVPVVLELLSPARRPIQVTADLPGFWAGSWSEVRKEMAGRYPKHDWPADPASPSSA